MMLPEMILWFLVPLVIAAGGLFYTYLGYPLLLGLAACLKRSPAQADPDATAARSVSVVICAFNAGQQIRGKLENLRAQQGLPAEFELVVASDGSTDDTVDTLRALGWPELRVFDFSENRGKTTVLNEVIPRCRGEIVVLTDVRQPFESDAIRRLLENFADPRVGAVSGELVFRHAPDEPITAEGMGIYWRYEKLLRRLESRVDSTSGCTGAIYAIRRALFRPIEPALLLDDVVIPLSIMRQGKRVLFDARARAYDVPSQDPGTERRRKIRTLAGNLQLVRAWPWLLNPVRNRIWWQFVSHKLLRLVCPYLLVLLLGSTIGLVVFSGWARVLLAAQLLFYVLAGVGLALGSRHLPALLVVPAFFVELNWLAVLAGFHFFSGKLEGRWTPTGGELKSEVGSRKSEVGRWTER